jgi:hypothetical protein
LFKRYSTLVYGTVIVCVRRVHHTGVNHEACVVAALGTLVGRFLYDDSVDTSPHRPAHCGAESATELCAEY